MKEGEKHYNDKSSMENIRIHKRVKGEGDIEVGLEDITWESDHS